jgi:hypothetical protein
LRRKREERRGRKKIGAIWSIFFKSIERVHNDIFQTFKQITMACF